MVWSKSGENSYMCILLFFRIDMLATEIVLEIEREVLGALEMVCFVFQDTSASFVVFLV